MITILNKNVFVEFRAIICDALARAYVTGTPGHTSSHGCTNCLQVVKKINYVLTYSTKCDDPISYEDFVLEGILAITLQNI